MVKIKINSNKRLYISIVTFCALNIVSLYFRPPTNTEYRATKTRWERPLVERNDFVAYGTRDLTSIPFTGFGMHGKIEGVLQLKENQIINITINKSQEGPNYKIFQESKFLKLFQGKKIEHPIQVDAISGATISSQIFNDLINQKIRKWNEYVKSK